MQVEQLTCAIGAELKKVSLAAAVTNDDLFGEIKRALLDHKEDFTLLSGQLKVFRKTSESGRQRDLAFCGDCGTSFYGTQTEESVTLSLRVSTARQAKEITPSCQMWHRSAAKWLPDIEAMKAFEEQPNLA